MSDLHYKLIVDMETRGSLGPQLAKIGSGAGDLKGAFSKIGDLASSAAGTMANAFTGAVEAAAGVAAGVAKIGAVAAGGAIAYGVAGLNNELEKAQVSLATIFSVQGQSNGMLAGMKDASAVIKDMRKDAADLPGEFKDLLGFFRMAATPGFQAGGDIKQIEKLSANAMATAAAQQVPMDQAARELAMLLQGRAGAHNVFGSLLGFSGDRAQEFNAMKPKDRLKAVEKELDKYQPSRDIFSGTFDAMSGTLIDNAKKFLGAATGGLFDRVKGALATTNAWFDRNEEKILGFAEKVGDKLSFAFEWGRRKIDEWTPAVLAFVENAYTRISGIWERVAPMIERVGDVLKKALSDPATFDRIEGILKMYGAVKLGGMVAPAASSIGGSLFEAGASSGMGIAELAASAGVAGLAVGLMGTAVYGAVDILTDTSNAWHEFATLQVKEAKTEFDHLVKTVSDGDGAFRKVADLLGANLLLSLNLTVGALDLVVSSMSAFYEAITYSATSWLEWIGIIDAKVKGLQEPADARGQYGGPMTEESAPTLFIKSLNEAGGRADERVKTKAVNGGGGTTIQKVEIVVSSNQDPSRIARAVEDRLANVSRNPTSSRYVRNWSANR